MYVRQKSWVETGPRGRGFDGSVRKFRRGMGQMTCLDGTQYIANFGCDDGSTPTCPSGYTLGNTGPGGSYSCVGQPGVAPLVGVPAPSASSISFGVCPVGQTCSIVGGIPDTWIYIGGAGLFSLLIVGAMKK